MIRSVVFGLAVAAILAPQVASARGWTVLALGTVGSIEECQRKAAQMVSKAGSTLQSGDTGHHYVAYGVQGLDIDAAIGCAEAGNGQVVATLSVHTWTTDEKLDEKRFELAKEMRGYW